MSTLKMEDFDDKFLTTWIRSKQSKTIIRGKLTWYGSSARDKT